MSQHLVRRRYDPYGNHVVSEELKSNPERTRRKQTAILKHVTSIKNIPESLNKPTTVQLTNHAKVGKYILSEINSANCMCHAIHVENGKEYTCRVVEIGRYRQTVSPYYLSSSSENVNKILEILIGDRFAYLFFDRSYGDLHSYVRSNKKLREEEACRLFKQIANVVKHCHSVGIVLRDLKLRKFVFKDSARTELKLHTLDDAIVINDGSDILYDKHGCPAYVSPEILESTGGYSAKAADIWSLGVMLFTMLCGRYPFHDDDPSALFAKIRSGFFTIPDSISSKGKCLLYTILRKDPRERLTAEELLDHPWFNSNFDNVVSTRLDRMRYDQVVPEAVKEPTSPTLSS